MPEDHFDVDVSAYEGIDILGITSRNLEAAAKDAQAKWQDNLTRGHGVVPARTSGGKRNPSYVNTGEARSDITVTPQASGALKYLTGGDVIQLAVAETGRRKTPGRPPPWAAIAEWAKEVQLVPNLYLSPTEAPAEDREVINAVRWSIAERGLQGFAPGHAAGVAAAHALRRRLVRDLKDAVREAGVQD